MPDYVSRFGIPFHSIAFDFITLGFRTVLHVFDVRISIFEYPLIWNTMRSMLLLHNGKFSAGGHTNACIMFVDAKFRWRSSFMMDIDLASAEWETCFFLDESIACAIKWSEWWNMLSLQIRENFIHFFLTFNNFLGKKLKYAMLRRMHCTFFFLDDSSSREWAWMPQSPFMNWQNNSNKVNRKYEKQEGSNEQKKAP